MMYLIGLINVVASLFYPSDGNTWLGLLLSGALFLVGGGIVTAIDELGDRLGGDQ